MKEKLPVCIENRMLPEKKIEQKETSYGYVSFLYILSLIITIGSIITLMILGNR